MTPAFRRLACLRGLLRTRISTFPAEKDRAGSMCLTGATWPRSCGRARQGEVRILAALLQPRHRLEHDHDDSEDSTHAIWRLPRRCRPAGSHNRRHGVHRSAAGDASGHDDSRQAPPRPMRPSRTPPRRWMPSPKRCGRWRTSRSPETSTRLSSAARFASG